jgi:hypothetical protein
MNAEQIRGEVLATANYIPANLGKLQYGNRIVCVW